LSIFNPNGDPKPILDMQPGGAIGIRNNWDLSKTNELTSAGHIDALLKGSALAKMSMGDAGATLGAPNDNSRAMMEKAAMLAHLKVANPTYKSEAELNAALDKIDPGDAKATPPTLSLSKRMEKQWIGMAKQYDQDPETVTKPEIKQPVAATATATAAGVTPKTASEVKAEGLPALLKSGKPVLLEVTAKNDEGSAKQGPEIDKLAAQAGDKAQVVKIDIDELNKFMHSLPDTDPMKTQLNDSLKGTPAVAVFDDKGQMKGMQTGLQTADKVQTFFNSNVTKDEAIPDPAAPVAQQTTKPAPNTGVTR
jgi:hypothetical protein